MFEEKLILTEELDNFTDIETKQKETLLGTINVKDFGTIQEIVNHRIQETISRNWVRMRKEHGLSRSELSRRSGLTIQCLFNIEHCRRTKNTALKLCEKIAPVYGMSVEDFIYESIRGVNIEGIEGKDIWTEDLCDVYPYNLVISVFSELEGSEAAAIDPLDIDIFGVQEALKKLSDNERFVLERLFREHKTLEAVGKETGVSRERIWQIKNNAFRKLRRPRNAEEMRYISHPDAEAILAENKKLKRDNELLSKAVIENHLSSKTTKLASDYLNSRTPGNISIEDLNLSVRSYNCLRRKNISNVAELIRYSEDDLMKIRALGVRSLNEIKAVLADCGYSLKIS